MDQQDDLMARLNAETGRIRWSELEVFFAAGQLVAVSPSLDLLEVARAFGEDSAEQVREWMAAGQVEPVSDAKASDWQSRDAELWAVVVRPWVLVQESAVQS